MRGDRASGPERRRAGVRAGAAAGALLIAIAGVTLGLACTDTRGIVQIAWSFVDDGGASVFPGVRSDSCSLHGALGGVDRTFDLRAAVRLCDPECPGGCDDDGCLVADPEIYSCLSARGSSEVMSSADPYEFKVEVIAEFSEGCACTIQPPCAEVPGPRLRMVRQGLITDLQVYQLVLAMENPTAGVFALDGCCALPAGCE